MNIKSIYDIAGRAMAAQLVRLNTVASNLANAGSTTGDPKTTYKPLKPIFETQYSDLVKKKWNCYCRRRRSEGNR
jgi:flagellar basal-body rod protein FlgC